MRYSWIIQITLIIVGVDAIDLEEDSQVKKLENFKNPLAFLLQGFYRFVTKM